MNFIYESPNKEWRIVRQNDPEWEEVFGSDISMFNICKYNESLERYSENNPKLNLSNYIIFHSVENLEDAFRWLRWNKVISSDEMKYQVGLLNKKEELSSMDK